jgi:bifunctional non-homologous end joining protein LigD
MTTLYYRDNKSDKIYQTDVSDAGNGLYNVNYAYGRRGSTLTTGVKNSTPLPKLDAIRMYNTLIYEKKAKGYTEGVDGAAYTATDAEERFTGVLPMLLNPIDEEEVERYLLDDKWIAQQKHDGRRIMLRRNAGEWEAINRKGLIVGCPEVVLKEAKKFRGQYTVVLDGEMVGETYWVFDVIEDGRLWDREHTIYMLFQGMPKDLIKVVASAYWVEGKRRMLAELKSANAEGIVFKHLDSPYKAGRPNTGGPAIKFKFYATASVIVAGVNAKRSVAMSVHIGGRWILCGNVTIPPNKVIPRINDIIEVRYLNAFPESNVLFQPVFIGPRDDLVDYDCSFEQLKFKAPNEEDEA